jgi:hypothetical protein
MPDRTIRQADGPDVWPALGLDAWRDTYVTVHMWTQVVGKVCLALTPLTNHFWNIAFKVTSRGLMTPTMVVGGQAITVTFDFVDHQLIMRSSTGQVEQFALEPQSVADFYRAATAALGRLDVHPRIWTMPTEFPGGIRFERDTEHHAYDAAAINRFWRALLAMQPIFERFRGQFIGKCSPIHFFWGGFDLAVTRFSGERAPERPGADSITRESYSHAVISHGFWPGSGTVKEPAFYAYAAPEPDGLKQAAIQPAAAYYNTDFGEFILPYEAVRTSASPGADLNAFLVSTYDRAADLAGWDRAKLERR